MEAVLAACTRHAPAMARVAPFAVYIVFLAIGPGLASLLPGLDGRWLYGIQVTAAALALVALRRHYAELTPAGPLPGVLAWGQALLLGLLVFIAWIHLDLPLLAFGSTGGFDPRAGDGSLIWPLVAIRLLGAALVVPVIEELFWRSLVMRWIDRPDFLRLAPAQASLRALLISSLVFGLEHDLWFAGLLAGLAYGWLYRRHGHLWLAIASHAATNLLLGLWVVAGGQWQFW
jgi:hypothetical protein